MAAPWFSVATFFKGLSEVHGTVSNPRILEMFRISGHPEVHDDETPWCAAFVGACLRLSGYSSSGNLGARSYSSFGQKLDDPQPGCIVVFWRDDPNSGKGHVAFFVRDDGDHLFVLGGNQGDAVSVGRFPKSRVLAFRWPTDTQPLPTDTTLPTILDIDPASAPPHLRAGAGALGRAAPVVDVAQAQSRLEALGFSPGPIDGEFGPQTRAAVEAFQRSRGLTASGTLDSATVLALGIGTAGVPGEDRPERGTLFDVLLGRLGEVARRGPIDVPAPDGAINGAGPLTGGGSMQLQEIVKVFLDAILARQAQGPTPSPSLGAINDEQLLRILLGALTGRTLEGAQIVTPTAAPPSGTVPPVLSPIDRVLGGEALAGKKTFLAVIAYVILQLLTIKTGTPGAESSIVNPDGTTHSVLQTIIAALGALGLTAKLDRVVQLLGLAAAKPPTPTINGK